MYKFAYFLLPQEGDFLRRLRGGHSLYFMETMKQGLLAQSKLNFSVVFKRQFHKMENIDAYDLLHLVIFRRRGTRGEGWREE